MSVTYQKTDLATPPDATVVATEQIAGEEIQRMKLALGATGIDDGNVSTSNPLPVLSSPVPQRSNNMQGVILYGPDGLPLRQEVDSGEMLTIDENLRNVFGTTPVITGHGQIMVDPRPIDKYAYGNMRALNEFVHIALDGHNSVTITAGGTWSGTCYYAVSMDGATWAALQMAVTDVTGTQTTRPFTTSPSVARGNVAGMKWFRILFGAVTSGVVQVSICASRNPGPAHLSTPLGTEGRALTQRVVSPYEIYTSDTHETPQSDPPKVAPVVPQATWPSTSTTPTLPTSYVSKAFSNWPQYFARVRTEVGGSERLPLAQEKNTNKLSIVDETGQKLLEQILHQLIVISNLLYEQIDHNGAPGFDVPAGFVELTKDNLSS